ncbi:MAG: hypothetical protein K0Q93_1418 [Nocardioidaceae bacterium]|nr:hypothetical protein [Nocardioidaceae bacterium]
MICVELTFSDDPSRLELRPQHRQRLAALHAAGDLVMAGPRDDESGALLVFACDRAGVDKALAEDPYYSATGVAVASVRQWQVVTGG